MSSQIIPNAPVAARFWRQQGRRISGSAWFVVMALSTVGIAIILNQIFNLQVLGWRPISTSYYYIVLGMFMPVTFLATPARQTDFARIG